MMMQKLTDTYTLSNGVSIPCVGFGTWQTPDGEVATNAVQTALAAGYRHIDTASAYYNEGGVGEGIRKSGIRRDELFLTTKHWITDRGYTRTIAACEASLKQLGVDYLDLYLIHWPCVAKTADDWAFQNAETWRGFETLYREGKIRAIGVSNFLPHHLEELSKTASILPMVNQIEFHPGYTQEECVSYCAAHNILVEAWSPLGCGALLGNALVGEIAQAHGKTPAQVCIRYALQKGVLPLPKSVTPSRIEDNTHVFDFALSEAEITSLDNMEKTGYSGYYPDDAPAG